MSLFGFFRRKEPTVNKRAAERISNLPLVDETKDQTLRLPDVTVSLNGRFRTSEEIEKLVAINSGIKAERSKDAVLFLDENFPSESRERELLEQYLNNLVTSVNNFVYEMHAIFGEKIEKLLKGKRLKFKGKAYYDVEFRSQIMSKGVSNTYLFLTGDDGSATCKLISLSDRVETSERKTLIMIAEEALKFANGESSQLEEIARDLRRNGLPLIYYGRKGAVTTCRIDKKTGESFLFILTRDSLIPGGAEYKCVRLVERESS